MMPYTFIVVNIPLQYRHNNRIASCRNYYREHFQYRPTLVCTYIDQFGYTNSVHTCCKEHVLKYDLTDTFKNIFIVLVSPSKDPFKHQV